VESKINYVKGDATRPIGEGNKLIMHVCNDIGKWGKGFVVALSKRWKEPELAFKKWYKSKENYALGEVQFVNVETTIWVANIIGQHKIVTKTNTYNPDGSLYVPVRYEAIDNALKNVVVFAKNNTTSIHMPRIGCGLAGGKWEIIEPMIIKHLTENRIEVFVYDI
jgi:O-acetyl-ADP-ribose deacetylase (regulator of RNase III)